MAVVAVLVVVSLTVSSVVLITRPEGVVYRYPPPTVSHSLGGVQVRWGPSNLTWSEIDLILSDGTNIVSWTNLTAADLTSASAPVTWHFGSPAHLGPIELWLNVTDLNGDGGPGFGDHMDITTGGTQFSHSVTYTLTVMDSLLSAEMMHDMFQ